MSEYPCTIRVLLPAGSSDELLDQVEDALLDDLDEVLGEVEDTGEIEGRPCVNLNIRDLLSGPIGVRRLVGEIPGAQGSELILIDESGSERREPLTKPD